MRKSTLANMMIIALIFSFGCKKDKSETTPKDTTGFSVKYDGAVWTASITTAIYSTDSDVTQILASNSTATTQVRIAFGGSSLGIYAFTTDTFENYGTFITNSGGLDSYSTWMAPESGILGQVLITEFDKTNHTVSGTFNFDGYNMDDVKKIFTEGKFTKVKYVTQ